MLHTNMSIKERIETVSEQIEQAALRAGRKAADIRLMAISKFNAAHKIEAAIKAGLFLFGESRVQEAAKKFPSLKKAYSGLEVHLVGNLQRNKAKAALQLFDGIQSLDRDELIITLGKAAVGITGGGGRTSTRVLLEMHTGEASKKGYGDEDALSRAAELVLSFPALELSGLMTMAPYTQDTTVIRRSFRKLACAQDTLQRRFPQASLPVLSMGMSNDFEIAVEEGATLLRIGTALFGDLA